MEYVNGTTKMRYEKVKGVEEGESAGFVDVDVDQIERRAK
jgi:hypothetical protein